MKQTAPISLDSFDPEVLAAAREVARRAGVPLESWIASVTAPEPAASPRRRRADAQAKAAPRDKDLIREAGSGGQQAAGPAPRRDSGPAKRRVPAAEPAAPHEPASPSSAIEASLNRMMQRLDTLDRSLSEEREVARASAARMIDEIETRLSTMRPAGGLPEAMAERFADIERRMGEISEQIAAPRPLGRRGRPLATEVREAVAEVRRRQRELEEGIAAWHAAEPSDPAARSEETGPPESQGSFASPTEPSPAIAELQRETSRLRDALGGLATGQDVGELERAMQIVATDLGRTRDPRELATIAGPIELMRVQVERLAEDVADNVHARVAGEVERLAAKVDDALAGSAAGPADQSALDHVFRELDEIRRLVAALAGPERIQSLAHGVQAISSQIAQLQEGEASDIAALRPLLEEIRSELKTPDDSRELLGRVEALAERIDRADGGSVGELIGRLEKLAEKVDRVSAGGSGLDALERHVLALATRLEAPRATDPALGRLERSMSDLLSQVSALRSGSGLEAALERAAREAIAGATGPVKESGAVEALRADLAALRDHQTHSDQRLQTTLDGVQSVLARLSEQLDRTMTSPAALATAHSPDPVGSERIAAERPSQERVSPERISHERPAAPKGAGATAARPRRAAPSNETVSKETNRLTEELLEPGTGRPGLARPGPANPKAAPTVGADIKTSFIAAARRAAQAAQAEAADEPVATARREPAASPAAEARPVSRFRHALEGRRRTLLLGLAAVVLALGAYQAFVGGEPSSTDAAAPGTAPTTPGAADSRPADKPNRAEPAQPAQAPVQAPIQGLSEPRATPQDPATTQSLAEPGASAGKAADHVRRRLPAVSGMASLAADLGGVPTSLVPLKQDALGGDAAAIWELAGREAEGRGVTRDLAIATKLYEKLAATGFAPAQFKTGNAYEKGLGVGRDMALAKLWYGRAADQGHVRSMHNLAVLHAESPAVSGKPDFALVASAFRRAAEYGVRDSQYNLAVLYARGLGVGQDLVQSYLWFSTAAAQGDEEAGRKRDEVAAKLSPKDLAEARGLAANFRPKSADPAANEAPAPKTVAPAPMSLMGVPSPGLPNLASSQKRAGV